MAKVYEVDPLVCVRCGERMDIVGFATGGLGIRRILDHLGLSPPPPRDAPPPDHEVVRVAEQGEGWGTPPDWDA